MAVNSHVPLGGFFFFGKPFELEICSVGLEASHGHLCQNQMAGEPVNSISCWSSHPIPLPPGLKTFFEYYFFHILSDWVEENLTPECSNPKMLINYPLTQKKKHYMPLKVRPNQLLNLMLTRTDSFLISNINEKAA